LPGESAGATVAVNVTLSPGREGFGVEARVVVVLMLCPTCHSFADWLRL
jgi:hypothetical protein